MIAHARTMMTLCTMAALHALMAALVLDPARRCELALACIGNELGMTGHHACVKEHMNLCKCTT